MYIVTGGAGFLGSAMVWRLNSAGITDILVVDNLAKTEKWKNLVNRQYTEYMHRSAFRKMMQEKSLDLSQLEGIVHMGACSSTTELDADFLMDNNLQFSKEICTLALEAEVPFINASSASTYGDGSLGFDDSVNQLRQLKPLNMYGYSKQLFDLWAQSTGALSKIASLKYFNVYGPNEYHKDSMRSVVCKSFQTILDRGYMELFESDRPEYAHGGQKRDFVYVKDVVEIMWWFLQNPTVAGVFNIGAGQARTWNDLLTAVFTAMGREPDIRYIPMPEYLKGKYQYFTEAPMKKLSDAGYGIDNIASIELGVADYVQNYLSQADPYL